MPSDLTPDAAVAAIRAILDDAGWSRREEPVDYCIYCYHADYNGHAPGCDVVAARSALDALAREVARLRAEKAPPEPPATTTHSAEDQGWTWSNVPALAPDATAQDASAGEQDPEALRATIRALTQEVKHLRAELVRVQGEVLDVD